MDHKFTGWLARDSVEAWRLSAQFKAYAWLWQVTHGEQVSGVFVNAVEWTRIPQVRYTKAGKEYQCRTHKVPISECRSYHAKRQLVPITLMPGDLEVWERDARRLASGFASTWAAFDRAGVEPVDAVQQMPLEGTFSEVCKWCEFKRFCAAGRQRHLIGTMMVEREERHAVEK